MFSQTLQLEVDTVSYGECHSDLGSSQRKQKQQCDGKRNNSKGKAVGENLLSRPTKKEKRKKGVNKENKNICITGQNEPARFDCILCGFTVNYYHIELLCVGVILMVKQQCGPEDIWLS